MTIKTLKNHDQTIVQANQCSFILRLWRVTNADKLEWRASIEVPESGKRIGFACLEQLFAFLINLTDASCNLPTSAANKEESGDSPNVIAL